MKSPKRLVIWVTVLVLGGVSAWFGAAFLGLLDSGKFEAVQSLSVSTKDVAILARRSDHAALSGDTYFVVIANHLYTPNELKRAFYSSKPVFVAGRAGLNLRATSPNELTVECARCGITKELFEKQLFSYDGMRIRYTGFP